MLATPTQQACWSSDCVHKAALHSVRKIHTAILVFLCFCLLRSLLMKRHPKFLLWWTLAFFSATRASCFRVLGASSSLRKVKNHPRAKLVYDAGLFQKLSLILCWKPCKSRHLCLCVILQTAPCCSMKMASSEPSAILFDIDGTLCNSFHLGFSATNTVLRNNGHHPASEEDYHEGTRFTFVLTDTILKHACVSSAMQRFSPTAV